MLWDCCFAASSMVNLSSYRRDVARRAPTISEAWLEPPQIIFVEAAFPAKWQVLLQLVHHCLRVLLKPWVQNQGVCSKTSSYSDGWKNTRKRKGFSFDAKSFQRNFSTSSISEKSSDCRTAISLHILGCRLGGEDLYKSPPKRKEIIKRDGMENQEHQSRIILMKTSSYSICRDSTQLL